MQRLGQVPEGSGADNQVRIRKVPVQRLGEVPEDSGLGEVQEGSGADAEVRKVPLGQVPERFGAQYQIPR